MQIGQTISVECYIQKTLLTVPDKQAFLAEKSSGKRVEFVNATPKLQETLRILFAQAELHLPLMPTIYDRFGNDKVIVRGAYMGESDAFLVLDTNVGGGGFCFS